MKMYSLYILLFLNILCSAMSVPKVQKNNERTVVVAPQEFRTPMLAQPHPLNQSQAVTKLPTETQWSTKVKLAGALATFLAIDYSCSLIRSFYSIPHDDISVYRPILGFFVLKGFSVI